MLMAALQGNPEDTSRFLGTMTGAVRVSEFYAPENVARSPFSGFLVHSAGLQ